MTTLPSCRSFGIDFLNLSFGENLIRKNTGLGSGVGNRGDVERMQRHGRKRDGLLFTNGEQHVHFPSIRVIIDRFGACD